MRLRASAVRKRSALLFHWDYRDGFTRRGVPVMTDGREGTFTRASTKTAVDSNGRVYTVPSGIPAGHHLYDQVAASWARNGILLEGSATNLCVQSENFGTTWVATGTPTRTAQAERIGTVYLDLIGDDDAAALEYYSQTITFTGDAVKAVSLFMRAGTSTSTVVRLHDSTAVANRILARIQWTAGEPVITMTTGTSLFYERMRDASGNYAFRFWFQSTSVTAANTNVVQVFPATDAALATSDTGNVYVGGVMAQNAAYPSSYIPTTTVAVTRAADALEFPALWLPRDVTIYAEMYELGTFDTVGARFLHLGDNDSGTASSAIILCPAVGDVRTFYENASASVQSDLTTGATGFLGKQELRAAILAAGVYSGRSIEDAAEVTSTPASALAHPATYAEAVLCLTPTNFVSHLITSVKIAIGERTMAQMREAV